MLRELALLLAVGGLIGACSGNSTSRRNDGAADAVDAGDLREAGSDVRDSSFEVAADAPESDSSDAAVAADGEDSSTSPNTDADSEVGTYDVSPEEVTDRGSPDNHDALAEAEGGGAEVAPTSCNGTPKDLLCLSYCSTVNDTCRNANQQFTTLPDCQTACAGWACGVPSDPGGDTVFCRVLQVAVASPTSTPSELETICRNAGPSSDVCH